MVKLGSNNYFFLKEDVISKFIVNYTYYTCNFKILLSNLHVNQNFWDLQKISKSVKLEITCHKKYEDTSITQSFRVCNWLSYVTFKCFI